MHHSRVHFPLPASRPVPASQLVDTSVHPFLAIWWNFENAKVENVDTAIENIQNFLRDFLPGLPISSFKCFGNHDILTDEEGLSFQNNAIPFIHVEGGGADASENMIRSDMLSFVKHSPRTRYVLLIAGDLDVKVVRALQNLDRTVLLAGPEHISTDLETTVGEKYVIPWEKLSNGELKQNPFGEEMLVWANERVPEISAVFWNADACPQPSKPLPWKASKEEKELILKGEYLAAINCIQEIMESDSLALFPPSTYYAYSNRPIGSILPKPVTHIRTSNKKPDKVENYMLVDVIQFTVVNDAPAYVMILTDDDNMATTVEILKMGGHRVHVVIPEEGRVDDLKRLKAAAAPNLSFWDKRISKFNGEM